MELTHLTIEQVHQGFSKKKFSALELTKAFLDRIQDLDKKISAFLTLTSDSALSQAKKIDDLMAGGENLPMLAGVPMAIKDNILVEDVRCTAASKILENYIAPYDSTVIERLKAQGAVFLGKTNLDEFAMGASTENSAFFPTKNPHDLSRVAGGSSGGSAAAVAADLSVCALGSDTGGSIRLPAAFCGVVGLKPTYGAVSRYGLIAMASSLDQIGPITKTVGDARIVFDAISGHDERDSTSVKSKIKNQKSKLPASPAKRGEQLKTQKLKIGVPREYFTVPAGRQVKGMDKEVEGIIRGAIKKFEKAGAEIVEVGLPHCTDYALAAYYIIMPCEVSANLARYDGIKYGHSAKKAENLFDFYCRSRQEGFGPEVKRRIMLGTFALSAGYYEAYYLQAQKVRTKIKEDFDKAFEKVDIILTPASPAPAFKLGEKKDPLSMYLADIFMTAVNLAGLPAVSLPAGKVGSLPVGLQLIGRPFEEERILEAGELFEKL